MYIIQDNSTSLLSVLGDDVDVRLSESGDKFISMEFEDTKRKTKSKVYVE